VPSQRFERVWDALPIEANPQRIALLDDSHPDAKADLKEAKANLERILSGAFSQRVGEMEGLVNPADEVNMARQRVADLEVAQLAPPQVMSHGGARPQTKSFAAETAAVTGESKSQVNRHIARAEALGDDIDRLAGTSLDKGVELDALKAMPVDNFCPVHNSSACG
jgi:hypothetical protein